MRIVQLVVLCCMLSGWSAENSQPCKIIVVDKENGWPVPLVELRTTGHQRYVTDNAGVVAFDQVELMGREVFLHIQSPGYGVATDGFGYRGRKITPKPGQDIRIDIERQSISKRIGRLTGGGLFAESQRCGEFLDWKESGIIGSDSVQCVPYQGRLLWLWGDSHVPHYPLGIFNSAGATSALPTADSLQPPLRLALDYFTGQDGRPRGIAPLPGTGPTWVFGMITLPDAQGHKRVGGHYSKIAGMLDAYETGLTVWNDEQKQFIPHKVLWEKKSQKPMPTIRPDGQALLWQDEHNKSWILFGNPFPHLKCPATFEAWSDPSTWESLKPQAFVHDKDGNKIIPHTGAIAYHPWRKRWVTVFMQRYGKPSALGEIWYAEADQPTGPWGTAVKILSHDKYTFYNIRLHIDWTPAGSPALYYEGTYTSLFTDIQEPTPYYDYNQILYRLDLDDPRLKVQQH